MNYKEMDDLLAISLNKINQAGESPDEYTPTMRQTLLNMGQNEAVRLLKKHYLNILDVEVTSQALVSGSYFDLSGLTLKPKNWDKGLKTVKITGGYYCGKISDDEMKLVANNQLTFYTDNPRYRVSGTKIYIHPTQGTTDTIDLSYRREPNKMYVSVASGSIVAGMTYYVTGTVTYNSVSKTDGSTFIGVSGVTTFTGTGYVSACCEFDEDIQMAILEFAKYYGFRTGEDRNRAKDAYDDGLSIISDINMSSHITDSITDNNPAIEEYDVGLIKITRPTTMTIPT